MWICNKTLFHVCWEKSASLQLQPSAYHIIDNHYMDLYRTSFNSVNAVDVAINYDIESFQIQSLSNQSLPSERLSVNVSG